MVTRRQMLKLSGMAVASATFPGTLKILLMRTKFHCYMGSQP